MQTRKTIIVESVIWKKLMQKKLDERQFSINDVIESLLKGETKEPPAPMGVVRGQTVRIKVPEKEETAE